MQRPHAGTHHSEAEQEVSRPPIQEIFPRGDEQAGSNLSAEGDDLLHKWLTGCQARKCLYSGWTCPTPLTPGEICTYMDLPGAKVPAKLSMRMFKPDLMPDLDADVGGGLDLEAR